MSRSIAAAIILCVAIVVTPMAQEHHLGTVRMKNSCSTLVQDQFERGMALLHSFEFGPAIASFTAVTQADSSCAMAYWGIAVARWTNPFGAMIRPAPQLQLGLDAITAGEKAGPWTEREKEYVAAVKNLYADYATKDQPTRLAAYEKSMAALAAKYPDDPEATIFWALSLAAAAPPTDKTYANQLKAAALLEKLFPQHSNHPGITHYIIHSYDTPALADRAVAAARRYSQIAPDSSHALHMPSHTFTRVGAWEDSITSNLASAESARKVKNIGETLHATDYLAYAYLQTGQDAKVQAILKQLPAVAAEFDPNKVEGAASGFGGTFAIAAIPARWALEHRDWKAATALNVSPSPRYPYTDAMTHFARALGAAHAGALDDARAAIGTMDTISKNLAQAGEGYWSAQVAIQRDGAAAWVLLAEGKRTEAVAAMRAVAAREDGTDKSPVTPGPIAPARELLGDMLLELKQPAEALVEYRAVLKKEPNRFRAIYGAAKAAGASGDKAAARGYFEQLVKMCAKADSPGRAELVEARQALK